MQTETNPLESESDTVAEVHYKFSVVRDTQNSRHKAVEQWNNENLKHNWKIEV